MDNLFLIEQAIQAREHAYAPYSNHRVGAVVVADGKLFTGCNIETCVFLGECAERMAIFKAISEGAKKISKLVVVTSNVELTSPCGICRQVMREFNPELEIVMANLEKKFKIVNLKNILPDSFGPEMLKKGQK